MDYGAVVSLKQTIERVVRSSSSSESEIVLSISEIESLSEQVLELHSYLEKIKALPSSGRADSSSSSERRVTVAAREFEDLIDSHISDLFVSGSEQRSSLTSAFSGQLLRLNRKISSVTRNSVTDEEEDQYLDYGAVASLKQKIEHLRNSAYSKIDLSSSEIASNCEQLRRLQSFLDTINSPPSSKGGDSSSSERRVKAAAKEFEDLIDSHFPDLFQSTSLTSAFSQQLLKVNGEISSLTQKLMIGEEEEDQYEQIDYGAVASLEQKIQCLVHCARYKTVLSNSERESNYEELDHWISFIDTINSLPSSNRVDASSKRRIKYAAEELEDLINSHLSDGISSLTPAVNGKLLQVRQEITSLTQKVTDEEDRYQEQQLGIGSLRNFGFGEEKEMGRLDEELRNWVLSDASELRAMLIRGMAGIGKTALAEQVYCRPDVQSEFDCCSFVSVGPRYQSDEIMLRVLNNMRFRDDRHASEVFSRNGRSPSTADRLCSILSNKKYLIVLDNMWNKYVWNKLKVNLPDDRYKSRVILTSTLGDFDRDTVDIDVMEVPLLNDDASWNLLRKLVFNNEEEEQCSREIEEIGKKIATNCEGLPLAIIEVAKLLTKTDKTIENWKMLAESEDPLNITIHDNTPLSESLSSSYMMLPQWLKVCFLYMAVFPKKYEIPRSKLIELWVSEGILEPWEDYSLEEMAEACLYKLISRSVVLNNKLSFIDKRRTKTCRLHFTFRNLCVNEANSQKFLCVIKKYTDSFPDDLNSQNRLCFHNNIVLSFMQVHSWMESIPDTRTLLCFGPKQQYPIVLYLPFRLLKVLDAVAIRFYEFPDQVLDLFHLRYLAITYDEELPSSISRLWNLQVLIINQHQSIIESSKNPVYLPIEIWKLHNLKHLRCMGLDLPDPSSADDDSLILEKLLTLSGVSAHSCTVGVLARIPNLKKIGIKIESAHDSVETFSFLGDDRFASLYEKFESFKCVVMYPSLIRSPEEVSSVPINFSVKVKKITLSGCGFPWEYMRVIAKLPNLKALKLRWYAFCGREWEVREEEFPKLKFLLLEDLDLESLICGFGDFPVLKRLIVRHCYKLKNIRWAYMGSLKTMELDHCTEFLTKTIQAKQQVEGNTRLQLRIHLSGDDSKNGKSELY